MPTTPDLKDLSQLDEVATRLEHNFLKMGCTVSLSSLCISSRAFFAPPCRGETASVDSFGNFGIIGKFGNVGAVV